MEPVETAPTNQSHKRNGQKSAQTHLRVRLDGASIRRGVSPVIVVDDTKQRPLSQSALFLSLLSLRFPQLGMSDLQVASALLNSGVVHVRKSF